MTEKDKYREWYQRGIRDGRQQVVEGLMNVLGLDMHDFSFAPVSEIELAKWFDHYWTMEQLRERENGKSP